MVHGQRLVDCAVKMAPDLKSHTVVLQFSQSFTKYEASLVVIHGVLQTRRLNWWHPSFSHQELHGGMVSFYLMKHIDSCQW